MDDSSEEADADTERATRHTWPKTKKTINKKDGKTVTVFPFLSDDNWQDKVLVRHLLAERPYVADFGGVGPSWVAVLKGVCAEIHPDTGSPIFIEGISKKTIQSRFNTYMSFVKWHRAQVSFHTGCDNEDPPTEIHDGLESMYDDWSSHMATNKEKRGAAAAKKQQDKVGAEALRRAALGQFVSRRANLDDDDEDNADLVILDDASDCGNEMGVAAAATPRSGSSSRNASRSNTPIPGNIGKAITSLEDSLAQRSSAKLLKEENKKRKLELQQQRIEGERAEREQRLLLDRERFELEKKNQEAQHQLLLALAAQLQGNQKK